MNWTLICVDVLTGHLIAEKCLRAYVDNSKQIGGCGKHVEIDESKFGKRKHWRGHHVEGAWVFGGVEREWKGFYRSCGKEGC